MLERSVLVLITFTTWDFTPRRGSLLKEPTLGVELIASNFVCAAQPTIGGPN
jgi:hypothetical protein